MNITLRQLRAFAAAARLGGFTRAAQHLGLTQSGLSVLVRELERELGLRLIDRTTRSMQLTDAGREFLPGAERTLPELQHTVADTQDMVARKRGRLALAAPPLIAATLLPRPVAAFRSQYPGITVALHDVLTETIVAKVRTGEVDCGVGTFRESEPEIARTALLEDTLMAVFPRSHPLAARRRITWADLSGQPLIAMTRDSAFRSLIDGAFQRAGRPVAPVFEVGYMGTAIGLVDAGLGISVLPAYAMARMAHYRLGARTIEEPRVTREISLVWRHGRTLSPAAATFAGFLREHARSPAFRTPRRS